MIIIARKKPVEVEAVLFTGFNLTLVRSFVGIKNFYVSPTNRVEIYDNTKWNRIWADMYIIKGIGDKHYLCSKSDFELTYDVIGERSLTKDEFKDSYNIMGEDAGKETPEVQG